MSMHYFGAILMRFFIQLLLVLALSGCSSLHNKNPAFRQTAAEQATGYTYIPVEPSTVKVIFKEVDCDCDGGRKQKVMNALPDQSIRISTRNVTASAGLSGYGASIGTAGNTYLVVIDYANTQTFERPFFGKWHVTVPNSTSNLLQCYPREERLNLKKSPLDLEVWTLVGEMADKPKDGSKFAQLSDSDVNSEFVPGGKYSLFQIEISESNDQVTKLRAPIQAEVNPSFLERSLSRRQQSKCDTPTDPYYPSPVDPEEISIPIYVGVGLRLTARVTVFSADVELSSLAGIAAAVKAGDAKGTLTVQTIGITGPAARSGLVLYDKIDETAIQGAIQALATVKASLDNESTVITPRILGFHNTISAGAQGVNLIHSEIVTRAEIELEIDDTQSFGGKLN